MVLDLCGRCLNCGNSPIPSTADNRTTKEKREHGNLVCHTSTVLVKAIYSNKVNKPVQSSCLFDLHNYQSTSSDPSTFKVNHDSFIHKPNTHCIHSTVHKLCRLCITDLGVKTCACAVIIMIVYIDLPRP